jgi:uncharacterized protein YndB with AHSA1/START domain
VARNEIFIAASPQKVFELLSDPRTYAYWVVGSREIRAADPNWPEPDTAFDHSVGVPPFVIHDDTKVVSTLAPVMLELRANGGPLGSARIIFQLQPEGNGTRVTMVEDPLERWRAIALGLPGHFLIKARNTESLRRLKQLGEGTVPRPQGPLPSRAGARGS